jgi:hypothetical protein
MSTQPVQEAPVAGSAIAEPWGDEPHPRGLLLAALRWAWDAVYLIDGAADGGLVITRADGYGGSLRAAGPLEARDAILADYARRPVAQAPAAGALGRRLAFEDANPGAWWIPPSTLHRVMWPGADGRRQEEASPTPDGLLGRLQDRGFKW